MHRMHFREAYGVKDGDELWLNYYQQYMSSTELRRRKGVGSGGPKEQAEVRRKWLRHGGLPSRWGRLRGGLRPRRGALRGAARGAQRLRLPLCIFYHISQSWLCAPGVGGWRGGRGLDN